MTNPKSRNQSDRSIGDLGEFGLISHLAQILPNVDSRVYCGVGDDAAVLSAANAPCGLLLTSDVLLEGRHFSLDFCSAADAGWKAVSVNVSDIAAMGGCSDALVVGLQLPADISLECATELYSGIAEAAERYSVNVVGGDTVSGDHLSLAVTVLGHCSGKAVLRSGAKMGDDLWVSGTLGAAAAGLKIAGFKGKDAEQFEGSADALLRHRRPDARTELGQLLGERGIASAMIDISDGLLADAKHIAQSSDVNLCIRLAEVPLAQAIPAYAFGRELALCGGDDYELLFCASKELRSELLSLSLDCGLTCIGEVLASSSPEKEVFLEEEDGRRQGLEEFISHSGFEFAGYRHF